MTTLDTRPPSVHDRADAAVVRSRLKLANAQLHAKWVAQRFGPFSPEYVTARAVVEAEREALVRAYDAAIATSRGEAVPCPR